MSSPDLDTALAWYCYPWCFSEYQGRESGSKCAHAELLQETFWAAVVLMRSSFAERSPLVVGEPPRGPRSKLLGDVNENQTNELFVEVESDASTQGRRPPWLKKGRSYQQGSLFIQTITISTNSGHKASSAENDMPFTDWTMRACHLATGLLYDQTDWSA